MSLDSTIISHTKKVLNKFDNKYISENGELKRSKVIKDLDNFDKVLMTELFKDNLIYKDYVEKINNIDVFKLNKFIEMFEYKKFWENSYTKYSNKIGLTADNKFIDESSDVVLDFPFKDTILKANMKHENDQEKETFLNETIAKSEIDELFEPKIFQNTIKFDKNGKRKINSFDDKDNLLIKGNNLIALHSIKKQFENKVKLIYIDVPFNTKNDFRYNDNFSRSAWLTFMLNRLEVLKDLLSDDGSIFVHIDWRENSYIKILLDSVFGENNFLNEIIWHYASGGSYKNTFAKKHDSIYWYSKSENYTYNPENKMVGVKRGPQKKNNMKKNVDKNGKTFYSIKSAGKVYKYYEDDIVPPDDVWNISILQQKDPERVNFNTQKPEKLLARIIGATTNKNDIVLDSFMGSATTQAVSMKMKRRFIGIEQMDYINTISVPRLQEVIKGEQSGISKDVNWNGGGSFVYTELMEKNQEYLKKILEAKTLKELDLVYDRMKKIDDLDFRVDLSKYEQTKNELTLEERQNIMIKMLDKNQLYYNYNNINDENVRNLISHSDYQFNKNFYKEGE